MEEASNKTHLTEVNLISNQDLALDNNSQTTNLALSKARKITLVDSNKTTLVETINRITLLAITIIQARLIVLAPFKIQTVVVSQNRECTTMDLLIYQK